MTMQAVPFTRVHLHDVFWHPRQETNRTATLPIAYDQCLKTGRIDAWKLEWKPGMPNEPHIFWDSDVAKWIEAAAYSLSTQPDAELEKLIDAVVALMVKAQQPDGYLNTHFIVVEQEKRWANLTEWHELYCAGHLIEAAVAYFQATGKRQMLEVLCRYADHIARTFGRGPGQLRGYCGHEEIELALVKLYRATGEKRYLELATYFIDERGQAPNYFELEAEQLKKKGWRQWGWGGGKAEYFQAHKPVREQEQITGHAVRAMYLYCGMADVAQETGDAALLTACRRIWDHLHTKQIYVTGGIGSSKHNEGFTFDYDLPNETAYCETCASVALAFWNHRLLQLTGAGCYADSLERSLYNAALSGVSLDGRRFFYANPLEVSLEAAKGAADHVAPVRQEWFGCACCPPNIARLMASVGQYFYSEAADTLSVHLYAQGDATLQVAGQQVRLQQTTRYPWAGAVTLRVNPEKPAAFTVALRIPGWCSRHTLTLNGKAIRATVENGYVRLSRTWQRQDTIKLTLDMPVLRLEAHPHVRMDCGRVALQRGPLVYCLEAADNGPDLNDIQLSATARLTPVFKPDLLGGVTVLRGKGWRRQPEAWSDGSLYRTKPTPRRPVAVTAVPYCVWGNRGPGDMLVWLHQTTAG